MLTNVTSSKGKLQDNLVIPDNVISIGDNAFQDCQNLITISIPDNVTSIGDKAFQNCTSLLNITFSDNITKIGIGAFNGCSGKTRYSVISETVKNLLSDCNSNIQPKQIKVEDYFYIQSDGRLTGLTELGTKQNLLVVPGGVIEIDSNVFYWNNVIKNVIFPNTLKTIKNNAFEGCLLDNITIPSSVETIMNAFDKTYCKQFLVGSEKVKQLLLKSSS